VKTLLAFVALTFAYVAAKFAMPIAGFAGPDKAERAMDMQLAWAIVGFVLLFGLVQAFITEWVKRSEQEEIPETLPTPVDPWADVAPIEKRQENSQTE